MCSTVKPGVRYVYAIVAVDRAHVQRDAALRNLELRDAVVEVQDLQQRLRRALDEAGRRIAGVEVEHGGDELKVS